MKPETLKIGDCLEREEIFALLDRLSYRAVDFVTQPGEFASRGQIIDIYPLTYRAPIRMEVELDCVMTIRDFSPVDGKTLTNFDEVFLLPVTERLEKKIQKAQEKFQNFEPLDKTKKLVRGDIVVHIKYGIGRFLGTKVFQIKGKKKRHLAVEYANREILYFDFSEPLERYIGGEGHAPRLTKLRTKEWERIKEKTRRSIRNVAHDLIEIQAKRDIKKGYSFAADQPWQKDFEKEFPFEVTADQAKAIKEVKDDMESRRAMDRLLCGDVGYGKTEVALRAAFKAVMSGRQVAFLVPTTVLAEQHYLVLKKRVESFPVTVEVLSRFKSKSEQNRIVATLKSGKTDIVVGTHRLLSKDIDFKDLGLAIIDEEQRFGVRHKEKLKHLRETIDVLTLTATPIPRTLYMAMMGTRDMSVISTPPKTRLPVETHVIEYSDQKVMDAINFEHERKGQIYFIHNRVQSIEKIYKNLKKLMPHISFAVIHGQMKASELEQIMNDFLEKKVDCLIATSIIESGIDIPNVNTILINRADSFGLSDLYQLRGRVGRYRGKRQAYAYLMVPRNWVLSQDAEKRLNAIQRFTDLGSGFKIALEDLEIRGAGNLLGHEQSGFIHAVGFDLYCRILKEEISRQKGLKS